MLKYVKCIDKQMLMLVVTLPVSPTGECHRSPGGAASTKCPPPAVPHPPPDLHRNLHLPTIPLCSRAQPHGGGHCHTQGLYGSCDLRWGMGGLHTVI